VPRSGGGWRLDDVVHLPGQALNCAREYTHQLSVGHDYHRGVNDNQRGVYNGSGAHTTPIDSKGSE